MLLHWKRLSDNQCGISYSNMISKINNLPNGTLWRHNQAGDLIGNNDKIDYTAIELLCRANYGKKGYTYTHWKLKENLLLFEEVVSLGLIINVSCNSIYELDIVSQKSDRVPYVTILSKDTPLDSPFLLTEGGLKVLICPAFRSDKITCRSCKLCAKFPRKYSIGFPAHGTRKRHATKIATERI